MFFLLIHTISLCCKESFHWQQKVTGCLDCFLTVANLFWNCSRFQMSPYKFFYNVAHVQDDLFFTLFMHTLFPPYVLSVCNGVTVNLHHR